MIRFYLVALLAAAVLSGCGDKDSAHPEPTLVPIYYSFTLYHIQAGDSAVAGTGSLDQTLEDKAKITIKLAADYRSASGNYTVTMHQFGGAGANTLTSRVGVMPANSASWQSDVIKKVDTNTSFEFHDLYSRLPHYISISNGSAEVAVGRWELIPE